MAQGRTKWVYFLLMFIPVYKKKVYIDVIYKFIICYMLSCESVSYLFVQPTFLAAEIMPVPHWVRNQPLVIYLKVLIPSHLICCLLLYWVTCFKLTVSQFIISACSVFTLPQTSFCH